MDLEKLRKLQKNLVSRVRLEKFTKKVRIVAGCDSAFPNGKTLGVCVNLLYPELEVIEIAYVLLETHFPYIPTFLSFRELPSLVQAMRQLKYTPDLIMVDGQGIAHPRGLGIAAHLGVIVKIPTIGVAKSRLYGEFDKMPDSKRGSYVYLIDGNKPIGAVLRTRENVKPVFVSPGNLIDVDDSIRWVLKLGAGYRLPEPTRIADKVSKSLMK